MGKEIQMLGLNITGFALLLSVLLNVYLWIVVVELKSRIYTRERIINDMREHLSKLCMEKHTKGEK